MSKYYCCKKHKKYREFQRLHYGTCIYCIMRAGDDEWDEEWVSWGEVAQRAVKISQMGFFDAKNGLVYKPKKSSDLYDIYMEGVKMWKKEIEEEEKDETECFPDGIDSKHFKKIIKKIKKILTMDYKTDEKDTTTRVKGLGHYRKDYQPFKYCVDIHTCKILESPSRKKYVRKGPLCVRRSHDQLFDLYQLEDILSHEDIY